MTSPVRLPTLDAMRGLVMAIMAIDHVDSVQNARHASGDAAWMASASSTALPPSPR